MQVERAKILCRYLNVTVSGPASGVYINGIIQILGVTEERRVGEDVDSALDFQNHPVLVDINDPVWDI